MSNSIRRYISLYVEAGAVNHSSSLLSLNKEMQLFDRESDEKNVTQIEEERWKDRILYTGKMVERVKTIDKRGVDCWEI